MRRKIGITLGILALIGLFFQFFLRYKILSNEGRFYRYDRLTGRLFSLSTEVRAKDPSEKAIDLVKSFRHGSNYVGLEIQHLLSILKGKVIFEGWKAREVQKNVYLVSCTFAQGNEKQGWWWEVNPELNVVRSIVSSFSPVPKDPEQRIRVAKKELWLADLAAGYIEGVVDKELANKYKLVTKIDSTKATNPFVDSPLKKK